MAPTRPSVPGPECGPSERMLSRTASLRQKRDSGGPIVGNEGLSIPSFRTKKTLGEVAQGGLETNFRRTLMHMRHGDQNKAIIGMRKFSMLMHELNEEQMWHGLETLKEASSDFERGNELCFNAAQMLNLVESELWVRLGVFAEVGMTEGADPGARASAFRKMEWLYPRLIKHLAEQAKPKTAVIGNAEEDGKAGAGLPAWNADAVRVAMREAAKEHAANMNTGAREVERKMASAILNIVFSDDKVDRRVSEAAFHAFDNIDSPIMTDMLTRDMRGYQLRGSSAGDLYAERAWRGSSVPPEENPDFDIDALDCRMIIRGPKD